MMLHAHWVYDTFGIYMYHNLVIDINVLYRFALYGICTFNVPSTMYLTLIFCIFNSNYRAEKK